MPWTLTYALALLVAAARLWAVRSQLYAGETIEEACATAVAYEDPLCVNNGTLHIGVRGGEDQRSCSYCDCDDEWAGVDCGRCMDISVCPDRIIDNKTVSATNCSSNSLIPTEEESSQDLGKVFSCTCGGGGDSWSETICKEQPDTLVEFTVKGAGTDADPASFTFTLYAGVHVTYEESWPGEYDYYYPVIFKGSAEDCRVIHGDCLNVLGPDLSNQTCVRYECENTQGNCPPEGYPVCDGFPECENAEGEKYRVHGCIGSPVEGKSLTIACRQEQRANGEFICYYQQPEEFAPISLSCSVGTCLYEGTEVLDLVTSTIDESPMGISEQSWLLVAGAVFLLLSFWLFAVCTDWGSAKPRSRRCCLNKFSNNEKVSTGGLRGEGDAEALAAGGTRHIHPIGASFSGTVPVAESFPMHASTTTAAIATATATATGATTDEDEDLSGRYQNIRNGHHTPVQPLLSGKGSGGGGAVVTDKALAPAANTVAGGIGIAGAVESQASFLAAGNNGGVSGGGGGSGQGVAAEEERDRQQPAVLEWKGLCYSVRLRGNYVALPGVCRKPEMTVLTGVSGYSGPRDRGYGNGGRGGGDAGGGGAGGGGGSTMTGILGPSGAGKSSLLDILAGRKRSGEGRTTGHISLVAGAGAGGGSGGSENSYGTNVAFDERAVSNAKRVRRVSGYVPQEDVLPGTLSCYEHLMFHARLRMPRGATHSQRRARALRVLEELGLKRVADSRIGDELTRGLSGGERRRLSIAAELMASPALLFLDEPTTGLDAAAALSVMTLLRGVATGGTTVLCSLHQPRPRVLNLLDKVMLLSRGEVAYFGSPRDAQAFFSSVGRPFPRGQPHPADAMLTLCSREDASALPSLFQRSSFSEDTPRGPLSGQRRVPRTIDLHPPTASLSLSPTTRSNGFVIASATLNDNGNGNGNGGSSNQALPDRSNSVIRILSGGRHQLVEQRKAEPSEVESGFSSDREGKSLFLRYCCYFCGGGNGGDGGYGAGGGRGNGGIAVPSKAGFWVQTETLSRRLLLRAVRHPLLWMLHFGGSLAMAICLGTIFHGKLALTFDGAQSRLGVLFFLLLYLSLLSLTSLPVWREDRRLFLTETMGGAYGHLSYFMSVALADILLVRVIPPLVLAVVSYPLMGLNSHSDGHWTLLWFALILVLANVTVALGAMGVGALGLPLDLANLVGGLMVLLFAIFGRFLLNGDRIPSAWRWLSNITPLGYAYESLLINEFYDPLGKRPYTIEGGECSADLPDIKPLGALILKAFEFSTTRSAMRSNINSMAIIAAVFAVTSFVVFFLFTRTTPLAISKPGRGSGGVGGVVRRLSRSSSLSRTSKRYNGHLLPTDDETAAGETAEPATSATRISQPTTAAAAAATASDPAAADTNSRHGPAVMLGVNDRGVRRSHRVEEAAQTLPVVLSWEGLSLYLPLERWDFCGAGTGAGGSGGGALSLMFHRTLRSSRRGPGDHDLTVLNDVSGFAGPVFRAAAAEGGGIEGGLAEEAGTSTSSTTTNSNFSSRHCKGTVTAIMGPSGAGKTSLLNVLAGRRGAMAAGAGATISGSVRINGETVEPRFVRSLSGFVTQEDVLPETLTCFEHLMFHAELRIRGASWGSRRDRVLEMLSDLNIEHLKHSLIGGGLSRGISGGEKRRLSIGTELLTRPPLLFLDEPTTGLDSSTALTVMQLLEVAAARGTTVICSLHQPRPQVLDLLDQVILMSRGRVAYSGAPNSAAEYFSAIGRPFVPPPTTANRSRSAGSSNGHGHYPDGTTRREPPAGGLSSSNGFVGCASADMDAVSPADAMLDAIGDAEIAEDTRSGDGSRSEGGVLGGVGLVVMDRRVLLAKVHSAEQNAPPRLANSIHSRRNTCGACARGDTGRTPLIPIQVKALAGRALLNVVRDPYLATLHLLLTPLVGVVVGSMFEDLRRLDSESAGVQGRLGVIFFALLYLSFLCLTSLAAWVKQMRLFVHERASGAYGAAAHLTTLFLADALVCRVLPPLILALTVRPLAGMRYGSLPGMAGALAMFNLCLAALFSACGTGARNAQEALALGCLVVLFSALLSGYLVSRDDLPSVWSGLLWLSPIAHGFEALVVNEFGAYKDIFRLSTEIAGQTVYSPYLTGDHIISCFGFNGGRFAADLWLLAAIGGGGLLIAYGIIQRG